jgi:hypothetical protein
MRTTIENKTRIELLNTILDAAKDGRLTDIPVSDIHHEVFNTDYFIIGRYKAEQWLIDNYGVFAAIETIQEYEQMHFGEVNTKLGEAEHVCNMLVYILGEEILNDLKVISDNWNEDTTPEMIDELIREIEQELN